MSSATTYTQPDAPRPSPLNEAGIEDLFIAKLRDLKYTYRPDICDRATLEANFRQKFEALNRVRLTDSEFKRLLGDLVTDDVFKNSVRLRERNDFTPDDGTPLSYTLVTLQSGQGLNQKEIEAGYRHFRDERHAAALAAIAQKHALATERLRTFVDTILQRMVFDGEQLTVLLEPLAFNWNARRVAKLALMEDLVPLLKKRAAGREIYGLNAYES